MLFITFYKLSYPSSDYENIHIEVALTKEELGFVYENASTVDSLQEYVDDLETQVIHNEIFKIWILVLLRPTLDYCCFTCYNFKL